MDFSHCNGLFAMCTYLHRVEIQHSQYGVTRLWFFVNFSFILIRDLDKVPHCDSLWAVKHCMVRHHPGVIVYGFTLQVSRTLELTGSACLREQSFNATPMHSLLWMCLIIQMQNCMLIMLFRSSLSPPIASYFLFLFLFYPPSQSPELWLAQLIPFTKVLTFKGGKQLVIPPDCRNLTNDWRSPLCIS